MNKNKFYVETDHYNETSLVMDVGHPTQGWVMYPLYLMDNILPEEHKLNGGRFSNFRQAECPFEVRYHLRETSGAEIANLVTKGVNTVADKGFVWDLEIVTHAVNHIEIAFKFKYDEDALIFKLMN